MSGRVNSRHRVNITALTQDTSVMSGIGVNVRHRVNVINEG